MGAAWAVGAWFVRYGRPRRGQRDCRAACARASTWPRMILAAALVAAQPLLDAQRRLIGAGIGGGGERLHLEHHAGIEMDHQFGTEAEPVLADGDVARIPAVEILGRSFRDSRADALAQCLTEVDVLARHAKRHAGLRKERSSWTAFPAFAALMTESASTPDILQPSDAQCRYPRHAVFRRWYRRTGRAPTL